MQKLKVGDTVQVTAGQERTAQQKRGKILSIDREAGRVRVEGLRTVKRHIKRGRDPRNQEGGIVERPGTIALSAVQVVCTKCDQPRRLGIRVEGEKSVRFCKKCETTVD